MRQGKPKKPSVEELLPLRLVGDFCSWQVDVPGLEFTQNTAESLVGGKVLEFFLPLQLEESVEFQIISSVLGFKVRLYPKEEVRLKEEGRIGAAEANALVGGSGDGHGRNFIIDDTQAKILLVRLALGKRGLEGPPLGAQVCYALQLARRPDLPAVTITAGKVTFSGEATAAWSSDPRSLRLHQLLPLRLVGKPCSWRLEQSGLLLSHEVTEGDWQGHSLCLRLLTREVEFQIVSDKLGFGWRLFPGKSGEKLPHSTSPTESSPGQIGGKDDGSGCNFMLTGRPLSVVTLYVWLKVSDDRVQSISLGQGAGAEKQTPQVAIGARRVQYPVPAVMTPLGPELLEAAETQEQREAALEQRNDMLRKASWRFQEEYDSEDVQQEVLALRQLYPYQQKKGLLALEMEGEELVEQEDADDGVQSYVRAVQEMKRRNAEDTEAETHADSPQGPGEVDSSSQAKPEAEASEEREPVPRSADEDLRQHCLRGLKAVQRQVAQHSESGEKKGDSTLALLPQNLPSALAGALSMCEGDSLAAAMHGARQAHLEQLRKQERVLARALQPFEQSDDETETQEVSSEVSLALLQRENLFGNTDAQFNSAVQNLPSVKAARERAMRALGMPAAQYPVAVRMTELLHETDRVVRQANVLCLKRLRLLSTPHPAIVCQAAEALLGPGIMAGHPSTWFFGLEAIPQHFPEVLEELNSAWKGGHFSHWFGGPRAGRYMTCSLEDLWSWDFKQLFEMVVQMQDQLRIILREMGEAGKNLSVETEAMVSFHGRGQQLPPWEDGASRRSRRISLVFHPSYSHRRTSEGGALRVHMKGKANQGKNAVEVPGGGAHWAVFRTPDVRQEVTKVSLPCGRWSITVAAEDTEVARKLRSDQGVLSCVGEAAMESHAASREVCCDCCTFAAGDGLLLTCPGSHRICRNCLLMELRRESVPSCPACAGEGDRVQLASRWQLMSEEHAALDDLGCCCTPGAEGCDSQIDVGSQVVIFGQSKSSGLNGVRARALWWDYEQQIWEVVLPSKRVLGLRTAEIALSEVCEGSNIYDCPSWQVGGRGLYPVSLGNRCCVKLGIDECSGDAHCPVGYPYFHGAEYLPFDSLLTSLDAILFFLRHDFANFFHYNDKIDVHPAGMEHIVFHNYRSWMHTFPHHHPQMDQGKLDRRIGRFRVLCSHSRNVRGARPLQFVRYISDAPSELHRIEELYSLLRLWGGPKSRLCYVAMLQKPVPKYPCARSPLNLAGDRCVGMPGISAAMLKRGHLYRHAEYPKVLFYLVEGHIDVMDFSPIREALRFNVYDQVGLLLDCPLITTKELLEVVQPFKDPYTNKCQTCTRTWLERPTASEREITLGFFPDCRRAQESNQGRSINENLRNAVARQDLAMVRQALAANADANTWNAKGRRPLHDLCEAMAGMSRIDGNHRESLQIAAELLLAHGDPRACDRDGTTVLALCNRLVRQKARAAPCALLAALLGAIALENGDASSVDKSTPRLFRSLELLEDPLRSKVTVNLLGLQPLRPLGTAELAWRNPSLGLQEQLAQIDDQLAQIKRMKPAARRAALRRLLFEWHPDKNQHRHELATEAFQHLQVQKAAILGKQGG